VVERDEEEEECRQHGFIRFTVPYRTEITDTELLFGLKTDECSAHRSLVFLYSLLRLSQQNGQRPRFI
jgi:hypothetical protein